jgi:hypothetical protein
VSPAATQTPVVRCDFLETGDAETESAPASWLIQISSADGGVDVFAAGQPDYKDDHFLTVMSGTKRFGLAACGQTGRRYCVVKHLHPGVQLADLAIRGERAPHLWHRAKVAAPSPRAPHR